MDHMATGNPFTDTKRRPHTEGPFHANEVSLANRNSGILLEALRHDVTPVGMHYLLNHFDVPYVESGDWQVEVTGCVERPAQVSLDDIKRLAGPHVARDTRVRGQRPRRHDPALPEHALGLRGREHCGMDRHTACGMCSSAWAWARMRRRSPSSAPTAASTAGRSTPMAAA